jgi:hypothetical protein
MLFLNMVCLTVGLASTSFKMAARLSAVESSGAKKKSLTMPV